MWARALHTHRDGRRALSDLQGQARRGPRGKGRGLVGTLGRARESRPACARSAGGHTRTLPSGLPELGHCERRPPVPSTVRAPPRPPIPSCDRAELGLTAPGRAGAGSGAAARKPPSSDGRLQPPPCCRLAPASTSATSKKGARRRHRGSALAELLATPPGRGGPQSGKVRSGGRVCLAAAMGVGVAQASRGRSRALGLRHTRDSNLHKFQFSTFWLCGSGNGFSLLIQIQPFHLWSKYILSVH